MKKSRLQFVSYDGKYPTLCSGVLTLRVDGREIKFEEHSLASGGSVTFDANWSEIVTDGPWSITKWPEDFPEDLKEEAQDIVNENVIYGCCGGCV